LAVDANPSADFCALVEVFKAPAISASERAASLISESGTVLIAWVPVLSKLMGATNSLAAIEANRCILLTPGGQNGESRLIGNRQRGRGGFQVEIDLKAVRCALVIAVAIAPLASAATIEFSFNGGGITSSGTLTFVPAPDSTSGVSTPGTNEITGITGTFTDSNDGVSGVITGLYTPLSYITPLIEPVAYTTGGLSYDDLFFPAGNSPADCPGYPFSGGDFDILGVAFNVTGGNVGEFFSDGN